MIKFLNLVEFIKPLKPVKTTEYFTRGEDFHSDGLFSEEIFGPLESSDRKKTFSYIDIQTYVIHPSALKIITQLDMKIKKFISTEETYSLDKFGRLYVDEKGVTGIKELMKIFHKINFREDTDRRKKFSKVIHESHSVKRVFVKYVPVIPPEHRPIFKDENNMWIDDPINAYYLDILRKSFHIRGSSKSGPLFDLLNYELQKSVNAHDEFARTRIQKKQGLIRSQMLGKRADFSGRAVIVPGPNLEVNEIGLPLRLAIPLFEPFIIHKLLYSGTVDRSTIEYEIREFLGIELSIESLKNVMKAAKSGDKIPEPLYKIIFDATEDVMKGRVIIAKRDPVLHDQGVRGFYPILISGNTLQLCTLQTGGYNADFDGDAMGVFHPITDEAQEEVKKRMLKVEGSKTSSAVTFAISKEMAVGVFTLTKDIKSNKPAIAVSEADLEKATDPYIPVKYRGKTTTMGKAIFNSCFPVDYPFFNKVATKSIVNAMIPEINDKYGKDITIKTFSKIERIAFKFATIIAPSITLDDIEIPEKILVLKNKLTGASITEADALLKEMLTILKQHLKNTGLGDLIESGSTKGWTQPMQILVAKGIIADPQGNILEPIKGSFADGMTNKEYFTVSSGSRKGIIDRVLNTAETGYMSRQLAYVLNTVEIHRQLKDCGVKETLDLRLTTDLMKRIRGRNIVIGSKVEEFDRKNHKVGDVVRLRTPIFCKSPKLCHTCYGKLLERHRSPYAGIIAAQIIGESGTQTIMRTFHTGGAVEMFDRDIISDIMQNDPLVNKTTIKKLVQQSENKLITLKDCEVTIDLSQYDSSKDYDVNLDDGIIWLKSSVCKIESEDSMFNIILDYPAELRTYEMKKIGKNIIKLRYTKNSIILEIPMEADILAEQIQYIKRILAGKEIFKDVNHLFQKLFKMYGNLTDADLVHIEILLSQCLRDSKRTELPARLGKPWNPTMVNLKDIVFNTSFMQGMAFENIGKAISTGLISDEETEPSILEQVFTGDLVEKEERY